MNIKSIDLYGKPVFILITFDNLVSMPTPMPENEAAFVYTLKGACVSYSEIEEIKLKKGDAILAKCGNSSLKTFAVDKNPKYSAISIRFYKDTLENIYKDTPAPFYKIKSENNVANSVKLNVNMLLKQYLENLITYFNNTELLTDDLIILKLKEVILLLLETEDTSKVQSIMTNLFEKKTFEFKEIVKAHICSSVSLEELASLNNMSLSTFKKKFKRIYNDTPNNYIINKRVEKVAELLPKSEEPITNIAYDCEFKTLAHMSRVFKTKYGVSPSEYRLNFSDK
ncbi:helix-turn-helix domain-containing protein [Flavivirga algicola]|uniref:Helix-turn-helix transcriptional regulator n=1 Tax=Flavivirga algicola TaxID=2729136 RepID=A0ABX1RQU0_9FLAO|nr:helix-turn-helix domain-containing protein [Flavivirga algicola]NMH85917.1 helix-turn-helix transcriptional regulator [Flavivirga algicola]